MVDEMKKKMRRFEHLIGFTGILNVTSNDSMKRLIRALKTRYKQDVQNSLRLHRLEFFYDLVEGKRRKGCPKDEIQKKKVTKDVEEGGQQQEERSEEGSESVTSDEVLTIQAKDVDDWKDLLTLSKIYYVLEHPRSEGLTWKRRITKKRKIDRFGDMDLIEWRVAQNFHLRGLEEWLQSRSDARRLAEQQNDTEELETDLDDDARELEELYDMLDPSGGRPKKTEKGKLKRKGPSTAERPFKFQDECIEDWTESYSEDSDYSDAEDTVEEIEDFPDEIERKMGEFDETKMAISDEEESISGLFSKYPEFASYREDIFQQMDKAETLEEWYKLYDDICVIPDEPKEDKKLEKIIEEEEEVLEEQQDILSLEEPKEGTAKQEEVPGEIEESLAEDQLKEKKLDVTGIEERGKEEDAFEKEKLSKKETDVEGEAAKTPQAEIETEEISKRNEEPKRESVKEVEAVKLETTVGVPEVTEQGTAGITKQGKEETEMSKMENEETEELTESRVTGVESGKEEEAVKLEAAKEVAEETGKGAEASTDALEEAAKMSKMEKEETEELTESKVPGVESGKEEEAVKLEAAKEVAENTGKGAEATINELDEVAKMSKTEKGETEELTESKELTLESEKEEDIIAQEVAEVPEQETAKEDAIKGSETKLNEHEKDLILGKPSPESEGVDKDFAETTNQTNTEVKKMAKKSASQEEGTGPKSEDEPDADS